MSDATEKSGPEETPSEMGKPALPDTEKILKLLEAEMQLSRERRLAAEKKQRSSVSLIAILIGFLFFLIAASFIAEGLKDAMKLQEGPKARPLETQVPKPEATQPPPLRSAPESR